MIQNFFKLTLRNLMRQKFSSFVNLAGLAIGFASFILIALYVYDEMQYDCFHEKGERIYRLYSNSFHPDRQMANLPALLYEPLLENLPEAEKVVRVIAERGDPVLEYGEEKSRQTGVIYVDPDFFEIFNIELERGSLEAFRENPYALIISREVGVKYFGQKDPLGLSLRFQDGKEFVIAGILKEVPRRTHMQFSVIGNYEVWRDKNAFMFQTWGNFSSNYYLLLHPGANAGEVASKVMDIFCEASGIPHKDRGRQLWLQPLRDIYLGSGKIESAGFPIATGNPHFLRIFSVFAILILSLACFNYVNLSTAKSTLRAREVGIRKVLGSSRGKLLGFFLAESFLVVFLALIISLMLAGAAIPLFLQITGKQLSFLMMDFGILLPGLIILGLITGLISGIYPAMVMARFQPVHVLKGSAMLIGQQTGWQGVNLRFRQLLIVMQFAISIGLVLASIVIYSQTRHGLTHNGFQKEALVVVRNPWSEEMYQVYNRFRNDLSQYAFVEGISAGLHVPGEQIGNQGYLRQTHQANEEAQPIVFVTVDFNYFEVLGARMAEGRNFDPQMFSDSTQAVILNQSAVKVLGLEEPVGAQLTGFWDGVAQKRVVGVVEDIHYQSMHRLVQPAAFVICMGCQGYPPAVLKFMVRIRSTSLTQPVAVIRQVWEEIAPWYPIDFFFLDKHYETMYQQELQAANASRAFTILAVLIACMGLLGTTLYIMETRRKEFGVRKVLGASVLKLTGMISREFSLLILLAAIIAWPLTYYFLSQWLDTFVYRIQISWWYFAAAGLFGWLLAMITVNALAWKQARKNPVESLKYE